VCDHARLTEPEPFAGRGRFYRFRTVSVWARADPAADPPMFYSGNSFESAHVSRPGSI